MHNANVIHKDIHSGNIFLANNVAEIGDLGLSKSATESDNDNEIYGILPYIAPEIFQGQKYTKASDIYSLGMIMWEFMTGRRPFWDQSHDTGLIIEICDGLRPPISTNAPKGYIELMQTCWHSDPNKRPSATDVCEKIINIRSNEYENPTEIIESPDIGPVMTNPDVDLAQDYMSKEFELDIEPSESKTNDYMTKVLEFDIDVIKPSESKTCAELKKCNECNQRYHLVEDKICHLCFRAKTVIKSGNEIIDDFIRYTLTNCDQMVGRMEFVPYDRFEDTEFIAEGGFSEVYKATWIDGPIFYWNNKKQKYNNYGRMAVALKKLNNSKNISSKELNELRIFYDFTISHIDKPYDHNDGYYQYINKYYGITQDPVTQDFIIIMKYFKLGDLTHNIAKDFFNISWTDKLNMLNYIILGLKNIHDANIIHKDYHSGNIFLTNCPNSNPSSARNLWIAVTGDLGISKSAIEALDEDNEIYGCMPYISPETFKRKTYTTASDIYSFGMIMWELMTGRKPFWDQIHDTELMIKVVFHDFRPPIVTNAPKGYIELMKECWYSDPEKRPSASNIYKKIIDIRSNERENPTKIIKSPNIGFITTKAIYISKPLSEMIKSKEFTRNFENFDDATLGVNNNKRKFHDNLIKSSNNNKDKEIIKKIKQNNKNGHGFNIDIKSKNIDYITKEVDLDIY